MMKLYGFLFLLCCTVLPWHVQAQATKRYATKVIDYKPAPGQFVNANGLGLPKDAQGVLGAPDASMISLGGFGGYIVVGFGQPVKNDPKNPYGVDFTVLGNAFANWSEPGAVMVMQDANGNGLADDTWYELAGSEYHFRNSKTQNITYTNPRYTVARDVAWQSDLGEKGVLLMNRYHPQPFYPQPEFFTNVGATEQTYDGHRINIPINRSNASLIITRELPFGYADNKPNNSNPTVPRNPYYADANGASADGFDIAWAVDAGGRPVVLEQIDFVKIYNPGQTDAGWLGEVSTEVESIAVTTPVENLVPQDYFVNAIGAAPFQILKGRSYTFEGRLFRNGIPEEAAHTWRVSDEAVGTIDQQGSFTALEEGTVTIQYAAGQGVPDATYTINVVTLKDVVLTTNNFDLFTGEKAYIYAEMTDSRNARYAYETYTYAVDKADLAEVSASGAVTAKAPGTVVVTVTSVTDPTRSKTIAFNISDAPAVAVAAGADHLAYAQGVTTERVDLRNIFTIAGKAEIAAAVKGNTNAGLVAVTVEAPYLTLAFTPGMAGSATVTLALTAYGKTTDLPVTVLVTPGVIQKGKQVVFVNGGQFGSTPGNVQIYNPDTNTTEKLADFDKAQSVQDMEVEGRYAWISAEYDIIKYDLVSKKEVARRYLEDKSPTEADGGSYDGAGLNHSTLLHKNMLIATRQNSYAKPEDGYNVRFYNKHDLSLIKKVAISTEASDVIVVGDSAFVAINGGYQGQKGSLAIIDLTTLTLKEEFEFGADGTSIMQMFHKDGVLYILAQEKILRYVIKDRTYTKHNIGVGHADFSSSPLATMLQGNTLYGKVNWTEAGSTKLGFGTIDLNTMTITANDIIGMNTDPDVAGLKFMAGAYDDEVARFYVTFGQWWGNGVGRIYDGNGTPAGSFDNVETSPERLSLSKAFENHMPYVQKKLRIDLFEKESFEAVLADYFADEDGTALAYTVSLADGSPLPSWITFVNGKLVITEAPKDEAIAITLSIRADDFYERIQLDVPVTITPIDDAPVVLQPIANIAAKQNDPAMTISLANTFGDEDNAVSEIECSVIENTNEAVVTTTLTGTNLILSFASDRAGQADITVQANSNGKTVTTSFTVVVSGVTGIESEAFITAVYPNPVVDQLIVTTARSRNVNLVLRNTAGIAVYSTVTSGTEALVPMYTLPAGIYLLSVTDGDRTVTQKIVKR